MVAALVSTGIYHAGETEEGQPLDIDSAVSDAEMLLWKVETKNPKSQS